MKPFQRDSDKFSVFRVVPDHRNPSAGTAYFLGKSYDCVLGGSGVCPAHLKREGDGKTPAGLYFPRQLYFRQDHFPNPSSHLPVTPITPLDGWCDDPACADYNRLVFLPHSGSREILWRDDQLYDLLLVISHNDAPVVPGFGSAVFFHIANREMGPTKGCVAFQAKNFLEILDGLDKRTLIRIHTP